MIKAIILDIDNTVYSYDRAHEKAIQHVYEYCKMNFDWNLEESKEKIGRVYKEMRDYLGDEYAAIHNRLIRFQVLLEQEGLPLEPHAMGMYNAYWENLLEYMEPSPGIYEFLDEARNRGIKIGIATDMTAHIQYRKLQKLKMLDKIDFMVSSEEAGVEKPNKRLFERCVEKAKCLPEECLMIGDSLKKDVEGARNAGMQAVHYVYGMDFREI